MAPLMIPQRDCGIIKAHTFGYSLKSHEQSSQISTRQGIHEITDLQDVLLCTQQRVQGQKQLGEMNIFTMATQLSEIARQIYRYV